MVQIDYSRDALITDAGMRLIKDRYLAKGEESPQEMYARAATAFSDTPEMAQRMYDYISQHFISLSTPIMTNSGTDKGLGISCYLSDVQDSRRGLFDHFEELGIMNSNGGALGGHWSGVRSNGTPTSKGSQSSGIIPFMGVTDRQVLAFSQGGTRRGAYAAFLDISHPEIAEFLEIRKPTGGDANRKCINIHHGVNVTDAFMDVIEAKMLDPNASDDWALIDPHTKEVRQVVSATSLWKHILELRHELGEPYVLYIDTANRALPEAQKLLGLSVRGSNLCVAGNTQVLTDRGWCRIDELAGEEHLLWNGEQFSKSVVAKTGTNQEMLKVEFSHGQELVCTPEHKFYVQNEYGKKPVEVAARNLTVGDKLEKFDLPVVHGCKTLDKAYTNGFFSGDGCYAQGKSRVYLYGEKRKLKKFIQTDRKFYVQEEFDREMVNVEGLQPKYFVPDESYDLHYRLEWLAGYLDADGCVARNGSNESLQAVSIERDYLQRIQLMLQASGVRSVISEGLPPGKRLLPANDGTGESKLFDCKQVYRLLVSSAGLHRLKTLGLKCNRLDFEGAKPQRDAGHFNRVKSISVASNEDTYCANEPLRHKIVLNGVLTGNCQEITLATNEKRSAVCCLSSLNASTYGQWAHILGEMVYWLTRYLDNVIQHFIDNAGEGFEKAVYSAKRERSIGIGLLGFHSYIQKQGWSLDYIATKVFNRNLFQEIKEGFNSATRRLAAERGECPDAQGTGVRNMHGLAVAPNASSSIICGTASPSIEPWPANIFTQKTKSGSLYIRNQVLKDILADLGKDTEEVWQDIDSNGGSVQHLDFLSEKQKDVFKTAFEVDQMKLVDLAADRQKHICQSQSLNLFYNSRVNASELHAAHFYAWKRGVKSLYYLRSKAGRATNNVNAKIKLQELVDDEGCLACEG